MIHNQCDRDISISRDSQTVSEDNRKGGFEKRFQGNGENNDFVKQASTFKQDSEINMLDPL